MCASLGYRLDAGALVTIMKNINMAGLDSLIAIYFGQDYDLFGCGESVEAQINAWIADSTSASRQGLIGDIEQFIRKCDSLENDFVNRYAIEFYLQLWEALAIKFLNLLKEKASGSLS